jgi:hypothetical protein
VQEHDLALPLLHPHGGVEEARQLGGERGQFVEVGGEQGAAAVRRVQMLDGRPGDRQGVERGLPLLVQAGDNVTVERRIPGSPPCSRGLDRFSGRPPEGRAIHRHAMHASSLGRKPTL